MRWSVSCLPPAPYREGCTSSRTTVLRGSWQANQYLSPIFILFSYLHPNLEILQIIFRQSIPTVFLLYIFIFYRDKSTPQSPIEERKEKKRREKKKSPLNFWYIVRTSSILISIVIVLTLPSFPPCSNLSQRPATRDQRNRPNNAHGAQSLEKVPLGIVHEKDTLERHQRPEEQRVRDGGRAKSFREVAQIGAKDTKPL